MERPIFHLRYPVVVVVANTVPVAVCVADVTLLVTVVDITLPVWVRG